MNFNECRRATRARHVRAEVSHCSFGHFSNFLPSRDILPVHHKSLVKRESEPLISMKLHALLPFILALGLLAGPARAQAPTATPVPPSPQQPTAGEAKVPEPPHEMTAADIQAFLDGFVPMQLERENIAGAVVLVVKRSEEHTF